jgi:hypothetical protein
MQLQREAQEPEVHPALLFPALAWPVLVPVLVPVQGVVLLVVQRNWIIMMV